MSGKKKIRLVVTFFAIVAISVCFLVYTTDHSHRLIASFAQLIDLPAGSINLHVIGFDQLYAQTTILAKSQDDLLSRPYLMDAVWSKTKREYAVRDLAYDMDIHPTRSELNNLINAYIQAEFGTIDSLKDSIRPLSVWEFKKYMLEPLILEQQIAKKIILDQDNDVYKRIGQIYAQSAIDPSLFETFRIQQAL